MFLQVNMFVRVLMLESKHQRARSIIAIKKKGVGKAFTNSFLECNTFSNITIFAIFSVIAYGHYSSLSGTIT